MGEQSILSKNDIIFSAADILDTEVNEMWDIFFPYMADNENEYVKTQREEQRERSKEPKEQKKPRRYMRFLTM